MFFYPSRFKYRANSEPFILSLSSDNELNEIRVRPFLAALLARGVIAGFQFADRKMRSMGWHKEFSFTHIWCHRNVSTAQYRFLRKHQHIPIIYDIDDLLTAVPDFVKNRPHIVERIHWCLDHARAVTTSTDMLKSHLCDTVQPEKIIILKNGHLGQEFPPRSAQKKIVWTSGDHPFVLRDNPEFISKLANIVNQHDYEMICIGRFDPTMGQQFNRQRYIQRLDIHSYRELLWSSGGAIGLAPLPSGLSAHNQRFFDAKSDVKLLDYISNGLVPICTNTPPYARSELYVPELGAADPDELLHKLDLCIQDHSGWLERMNRKFHGNGALDQRRYTDLSQSLDSVFKTI
jgi:ribulose bisphosphate carboxylase small subunit